MPLGPIKQHTGEKVAAPLTLQIYPGANATFKLYEDDGKSFNYRRGEWMGINLTWNDATRRFALRLAKGSRMLAPIRRRIELRIVPEQSTRSVVFQGHPVEVRF